MRKLALLPVIALAACVESSIPTQPMSGPTANGAHLVHTKEEVLSMPTVACNGETVDLSGTMKTTIDFKQTPSGHTTSSVSLDFNLSGVGSVTGAKYHAKQKISESAKITDDKTDTKSSASLHMVGQGKVPDTIISFSVRVVVVDGDLKTFRMDETNRCK
jgi:hypothetical protein